MTGRTTRFVVGAGLIAGAALFGLRSTEGRALAAPASAAVARGRPWNSDDPHARSVVLLYYGATCTASARPARSGGLCSGVLIDRRWVLTAAHCLDRMPTCVGVGPAMKQHRNSDLYWVDRGHCFVHPRAMPAEVRCGAFGSVNPDTGIVFAHDLGLVRLAREVPEHRARRTEFAELDEGVLPADLPVQIAGFGRTEVASSALSEILMLGTVKKTESTESYLLLGESGDFDAFALEGDSGGPVFLWPRWASALPLLIGVISAGYTHPPTLAAPVWRSAPSGTVAEVNFRWVQDILAAHGP